MREGNVKFAEYVEQIEAELSRMASERKMDCLAYLLGMASQEAREIRQLSQQLDSRYSSVNRALDRVPEPLPAA